MLCDYGCGKEAIHQFKNGKWCCARSVNSCPEIKRKKNISFKTNYIKELNPNYGRTPWNKGIPHSEKTRSKMSKSHKGLLLSEKHKKAIGKSNTNPSKETRSKMSKAQKGKIITPKQRNQISEANRFSIEDVKTKFPIFSKFEDMRYNPDNLNEKEIQVHCKNHNCPNSKENGGWFTPTKSQWYERIRSVENEEFRKKNIENNFYCSKYCKKTCKHFKNKMKRLGQMRSELFLGDGNPNWCGGISHEPYCKQWSDKDYKDSIKKRDGYKCLNPECNKTTERLCIHHINYIKKNCHPLNLITVCISCNSKANIDREWHESWYKAIIKNRYIKH